MPEFIPGLELCGLFFREVVRPLLARRFPGLHYSAALIGYGSEVLGFDTAMSTDHDWGPRLLLFLAPEDFQSHQEAIRDALRDELPKTFRHYATFFPINVDNPDPTQLREHRVQIFTLNGFVSKYLDFDLEQEITPEDWLTFPEQKLRALTSGAVYHDEAGLQTMRYRFAYYPPDVWLYFLASGWTRIGQEEHLMGRAGFVGDELGSALIASRLVRDIMRLCFLMEKQYAPYPKWFGTAFARLDCAPMLLPILRRVTVTETWQERQEAIAPAYEVIARMHNALGITRPLPEKVTDFFNRPFKVIHLEGGFADAIHEQITGETVKRIAAKRLIGGIDQFSDSTDLLEDTHWRRTLRRLYEG